MPVQAALWHDLTCCENSWKRGFAMEMGRKKMKGGEGLGGREWEKDTLRFLHWGLVSRVLMRTITEGSTSVMQLGNVLLQFDTHTPPQNKIQKHQKESNNIKKHVSHFLKGSCTAWARLKDFHEKHVEYHLKSPEMCLRMLKINPRNPLWISLNHSKCPTTIIKLWAVSSRSQLGNTFFQPRPPIWSWGVSRSPTP